jgi:F-type H+-transporting ATPase subunit alpha
LHRGQRLVEILKQDQYVPLQFEQQIVIIFAATNGYIDSIAINQIRRYEKELLAYLLMKHPKLLPDIAGRKIMDDDIKQRLAQALQEFSQIFKTEEK